MIYNKLPSTLGDRPVTEDYLNQGDGTQYTMLLAENTSTTRRFDGLVTTGSGTTSIPTTLAFGVNVAEFDAVNRR